MDHYTRRKIGFGIHAGVEEVLLNPGQTYSVSPKRPHLVTNARDASTTFLVLQGIGEYDYVPMV